jgi:ssDNA-binding Zn-finger/Zn-ribbon topoisomerase 1
MKVLYYCGIDDCEQSGTLTVESSAWEKRELATACPECGKMLHQKNGHFENFNEELHKERAVIFHRAGPLSDADRARLRKIHELLGHGSPEGFSAEQESLVMRIASEAMQRLRNEGKN